MPTHIVAVFPKEITINPKIVSDMSCDVDFGVEQIHGVANCWVFPKAAKLKVVPWLRILFSIEATHVATDCCSGWNLVEATFGNSKSRSKVFINTVGKMETTKIRRLSIFIKDDEFIFNLITKISGVVSWSVFCKIYLHYILFVLVKFTLWPLHRKFVYFSTIFHFQLQVFICTHIFFLVLVLQFSNL